MAETHINAYLSDLHEAEEAALVATARVEELKGLINQRLAANEQEPMFDETGKRIKRKKSKEPTPPGADGFGTPNVSNSTRPKVDSEGNA